MTADTGPGPSKPVEGPRCSASTLNAEPSAPRSPLPPAVESMRRRIIAAAVACDYEALARLASEKGAELSLGFGTDTDVAATWRKSEQDGVPVLAQLVKVLNVPHTQEETVYVWPSAFSDKDTPEDWKALEGLYPAERLAQWREGDGYTGFRTGIDATGDWQFALRGD